MTYNKKPLSFKQSGPSFLLHNLKRYLWETLFGRPFETYLNISSSTLHPPWSVGPIVSPPCIGATRSIPGLRGGHPVAPWCFSPRNSLIHSSMAKDVPQVDWKSIIYSSFLKLKNTSHQGLGASSSDTSDLVVSSERECTPPKRRRLYWVH